MTPDAYARADATALAALIRSGETDREAVLAAARARIAARNPALNAIVELYDTPAEDDVPSAAFAGVPFLLKDIGAGLAGRRTRAGSAAFDATPPQTEDDALTRRFRHAGLSILGKTNLPELGFNVTTEPRAFGPTRNPFDPARSAGGSSGGSAAAVAAGMVPLAHATDGAGSIRIPAACCGLVGLKPSRGLIPQGPAHADIYGGLVSEGVLSRSVRDSAAALALIAGRDPGAPCAAPGLAATAAAPVRIGLLVEGAEDCAFDPDALAALAAAADRLAAAGHRVAPVGRFLAPADWRIPREVYLAQVCAQAAADFAGRPIPDALEPINRAAIRRGRDLRAAAYLATVRRGQTFARRFAAVWDRFDVLLSPTLAGAAPPLGRFPTDHEDLALHVDRMTRLAPFAGLFNLTGGPALTVNAGQTAAGLPLGVQLAADLGGDTRLLALGELLHLPPEAKPAG